MSEGWLRESADGALVLTLHVQPNAKKTAFAGLHGGALKLRLAAAPVEGRANAALCAFLAEFCEVPKSSVSLLSGESSRVKRIRIDAAGEVARRRLRALVAEG